MTKIDKVSGYKQEKKKKREKVVCLLQCCDSKVSKTILWAVIHCFWSSFFNATAGASVPKALLQPQSHRVVDGPTVQPGTRHIKTIQDTFETKRDKRGHIATCLKQTFCQCSGTVALITDVLEWLSIRSAQETIWSTCILKIRTAFMKCWNTSQQP